MKFLYSIVLLSVLVAAATASMAEGQFKDPAHPGKCVVDGQVLSPFEEVQTRPDCGRMICGNDGWVQFHSCGVQGLNPGFKLGEPVMPNADYPACCERTVIPEL